MSNFLRWQNKFFPIKPLGAGAKDSYYKRSKIGVAEVTVAKGLSNKTHGRYLHGLNTKIVERG